MRKILRSPVSPEKEEVLKSLFSHPKPDLLDDLLLEATDQNSYHREVAIFALGAYPDIKVERELINLLDDPFSDIRSTAAKSLARIGNYSQLDTVKQQAQSEGLSPIAQLNYLIALNRMDPEREYLRSVLFTADPRKGSRFEQSIFSLVADMLRMEPRLAHYYQNENMSFASGFEELIDETKALTVFLTIKEELLTRYRDKEDR